MSNNKQQTAVSWFVKRVESISNDKSLTKEDSIRLYNQAIEQAKEKYEHEMCVFADEYASYVLEQGKPGIKGAMVSMCAWTFFKNRRK
jgi:type IV secretory pathway TrbF-like protein